MTSDWQTAKEQILYNLRRIIPTRPVPPPKTQKSFATLRPGQLLIDINGTSWEVTETTNQGATIGERTNDSGIQRLLGKDWKESYTRVRKAKHNRRNNP